MRKNDDLGKNSIKRVGRDDLMTERGNRGATLSPTSNNPNPEVDKRLSTRLLSPSSHTEWNDQEEPYIKKWIDYSNKYGIGYILTTDLCGVYFNDNSKIILHPDNFIFDYFEKSLDKRERHETHTLNDYTPELKKKVTLLIHFKNFMEGIQSKTEMPKPNPKR